MTLLTAGNVTAQEPRPLLEGPDFGGARQIREGIIQRAQNARIDILGSDQEGRSEIQSNIQYKIEQRKLELKNRRLEMLANSGERKTLLSGDRLERVAGLFEKMFTGFDSTTDKLSSVHNRLSSKISNLSDENVDINQVEILLEAASSLLNVTKSEIAAVQIELDEAIKDEITKEYISELITEVKENIRTTQEAYQSVINEINQ